MSGIIYRVSGSVVTAKDVENASMYNVVRVGTEGLIGEIIKLEGNSAIVQVYEDTTGLRPGEPVVNTNAQLSVLLGPGLIGSIFDGIQRPLDKIKAQSGDFITKGVNVDPLDLKKKWHFTPKVKKGDNVTEGSIVGEVAETSLITHKVLVPLGVNGVVSNVYTDDRTINDTVVEVKKADGSTAEVKLSQRWPVRSPRPVKSKLPPEIPLITGQRVIDTLFPVAKGGTAAVPGPFGSGKCVAGDTPVLLGDGSKMEIRELYERSVKFGTLVQTNGEEFIKLQEPVKLFSFHDGKISRSESHLLYKGKSNSLIRVKTQSGREVRVTPIHKLFKEAETGKIVETMAGRLVPGDRIAAVRNSQEERHNLQVRTNGTSALSVQIETQLHNSERVGEMEMFFDEIVGLEQEEGCFDVYDLTLPDYGYNFVGGYGGLVLHNTVIQHQLSKWSDSEIVVYVGCGERGNEMTEILTTFPELQDPKSGKPLMDRTVLIANTSNMPVAAREASIYTGITIAEFYRDMGYSVALMADSTSRWAEALREISGRLEEMPGEEGYPAYLGRRVAEFYERAGRVEVLSGKIGSVTAIGAVSPPGGDTSEPVSQNTLRVTRVFWALDASLANARHFPSINWLNSYSLYGDELSKWYQENAGKDWPSVQKDVMATLQKESEINDVVQLVGYDALPESEKMTLDIAKVIREDYLQQSAFDDVDTYTSMKKQYLMLKSIMQLSEAEGAAVQRGVLVSDMQEIDAKQKIARMKYAKEADIDKYYKDTEGAISKISSMKARSD